APPFRTGHGGLKPGATMAAALHYIAKTKWVSVDFSPRWDFKGLQRGDHSGKRIRLYTGGATSRFNMLRSTPSAMGTAPTRMKIMSPAMRTHSSLWKRPPIRNVRRREIGRAHA